VRETAEILRDSIRETDRLFSLGGEEFMIVCPNVDGNQLLECAERLRALIEVNTVIVGNTTHHVTMSVGVASNQDVPQRTADELLRRSQQALLSAQQQGCNRLVCWEASNEFDPLEVLSIPSNLQQVAGR
jgi:diguanylate cyclase (GGDEF)-like protein